MVRKLSRELQEKAVRELNEVPERVEEDIKAIQEWIQHQPYLNAPTDEQWILGFLRGCKFSLQLTKDKLDTFCTVKNLMPETMMFRSPLSSEIQALLRGGAVLPLEDPENYIGPKVILFRFQNCDTSQINLESLVALLYMMLNILMVEDDNLMVSGVIFWSDMSHFPLSFVLQLTPKFLNNFFICMQNAFPLRLKGIHFCGSPGLARKCFNMFKGFLAPKLRKRVVFYEDDNFKTEGDYQILTERMIPAEYGGKNSNVEDIAGKLLQETNKVMYALSDGEGFSFKTTIS